MTGVPLTIAGIIAKKLDKSRERVLFVANE
jgi:hypothetical protein